MSIDRDRNVYGQSLGVDMGPEKGVAVIHHEKAEYLKTIGFDFGGDPEELKRDGASVSDKIPGVKMYLDLHHRSMHV